MMRRKKECWRKKSKNVLDLKKTKNLINDTMEKDLRGIKLRNKIIL